MSAIAPIWVVDDDRSIRWVLEKALARAELPCRLFNNAQEMLEALEHGTPQVIVSDIRMPHGNGSDAIGSEPRGSESSGIELLRTVKTRLPALPVIIMTAYSDLESAVSAFQAGAFEYLAKPFDVDRAVALIQRALDESRQESSAEDSPAQVPEILGQAPSMQEVFRAIGRLSQSTVTVLITGESGSGKEVVAQALHKHSVRGQNAFIALNMAAIPRDLMESELFGHERGAFTGAQSMRQGRFEQAQGGTLFLDEIGDMPPELQTRLLRVLSDGFFYRVGGHQPIKADVRVIAATHHHLEERVRQGLFREDLYHRLNVIRLHLPPLRERREDIALLARHFLAKSAKELGVEVKRLSAEAQSFIEALPFPGNVRQLENLCHWLSVLAPAQVVKVEDLPLELRQAPPPTIKDSTIKDAASHATSAPIQTALSASEKWQDLLIREVQQRLMQGETEVMNMLSREFEAALINTALSHTQGRRQEAAARLGIGRNTLTRKVQELGLQG